MQDGLDAVPAGSYRAIGHRVRLRHLGAQVVRVYKGAPVLSRFRTERLLDRLKQAHPSIVSISADEVYLIRGAEELTSTDESLLSELLDAAPAEVDGFLAPCAW